MKSCPLCGNQLATPKRILNNVKLLGCAKCTFVFADYPDDKTIEYNENFDAASADAYANCQTSIDTEWFRQIARHFTKLLGSGSVLDVGCGNGKLLREFQIRGWKCTGIDPSPWGSASKMQGIKLMQCSLENNPDIGTFNLIVSSSTLEHIPDPVRHVKAIQSRLKKNGCAYFCGIPNYGSLTIKLGISRFYMNYPPGHVNYFDHLSMKYLLDKCIDPGGSYQIRTYGIPEMHCLYNALINTTGYPEKKNKNTTPPIASIPLQTTVRYRVKKIFLQCLLGGYYYSGRLMMAGDKLEIIYRK